MKTAIITLLASVVFSAYCGGPVVIFADGQYHYEIVKGRNDSRIVDFAARELQYHMERAAGRKIRIAAAGDRDASKKAVYIGLAEDQMPERLRVFERPNGYTVQVIDGDIYIAGDDADGEFTRGNDNSDISPNGITRYGTLFGVYEFIENTLNAKWLWPGELGEYIPPADKIEFDGEAITARPKLRHARLRYNPTRAPGGWADDKTRRAFIGATQLWLLRHRIVRGMSLEYGHAFEDYYGKYKNTHPDFFNLLPDGKRYSDPMYCRGAAHMISMCVTNPAFHDKIIEEWAKTRNPRKPLVNCAENDTLGKCMCAACMAADRPNPDDGIDFRNRAQKARKDFLAQKPEWVYRLGSVSDRYAAFYNAVLRKARAVDPEAMVLAYSYVNYSKPPREVKLSDKVVVGIVPQLIFPWTDAKRKEFREQWDGWAKAGAQLYLRPNYTLDGHNFPIYYADAFAEDFQYAWDRNMFATDFDSLNGQYATQGLNIYTVARMQLRGGWDKERIFDEYYRAFGPAEAEVRDYFAYWRELSARVDEKQFAAQFDEFNFASYLAYFTVGHKLFTPEIFSRGYALLDKAKAAAGGDELAARRVEFLRRGLRNAELTAATQKAFLEYRKSGNFQLFADAVNTLDRYRAEIEGDFGCDFTFLAACEQRAWDRKLITLAAAAGAPLNADWRIHFDAAREGESKRFFQPDYPIAGWEPIEVGAFYNQQAAGVKWKKAHGNTDFSGICWYKARFRLEDAGRGESILTFGAVDEACKVYVNGKLLLDRPFPYRGNRNSWAEPFEVNATGAVKAGDNDLTVMVVNNVGMGGIWRPVYLKLPEKKPVEGFQ